MIAVAVFLGGGLGAVSRWAVGRGTAAIWPQASLPIGTAVVNIAGCFALGLIATRFTLGTQLSEATRAGLTTGFLGGLTTFSTFGHESVRLWSEQPLLGALNVGLNLCVGLGAAAVGVWVARL